MSVQIFIINATSQPFELFDLDKNHFGLIANSKSYSLRLNYSENFEKQYNIFYDDTHYLSFWININGEISQLETNNSPYTLMINRQVDAFLNKFIDWQHHTNNWNCHSHFGFSSEIVNKLIILPKNKSLIKIPFNLAPPVIDQKLRLDFHP